jgi:hypothetical protein
VSDGRQEIGQALTVWAAVAGAIFAAAITALFATVPVWGWITLIAFGLLTGTALLSFSDLASRNFLAGTLRHRTYTQIYTTLTRRMLLPLWAALCDEPGNPKQMERERIPVPTLFRHALTWRLYDRALLIAVAYPVLLPVLQWLVTGAAALIGNFEFMPAAPFWWERTTILSGIAFCMIGVVLQKRMSTSRQLSVRNAGYRFLLLTFSITGVFAIAFLVAGHVLFTAAVAVLLIGSVVAASVLGGTVAFAMAVTFAFAILAYQDALYAYLVLVSVAFGVTFAVIRLTTYGRHDAAGGVATIFVPLVVIAAIVLLDFKEVSPARRSLFLFLAVLPLLNTLFDTLSYAVTLTLMRRGLRSRLPLLWGLLDLAIACLLFLALGATLIVVIHGLNTLAGAPLVDLPALLAGIHERPGDYIWLYAMLFSTILPTALHGLLSLLGVQGLWPRAWRRPVAAWVEAAPASALAYLRAGLALGLIWTLPLLALGAVLWLLWALGGAAVTALLGRYFDLLLWLAAVPVGAV